MPRLRSLLPALVVLTACGGGSGSPKSAALPSSTTATTEPSAPTIASPGAPSQPALPPVPSSPAPAPDGLIVTATSPALTALLPAVAAYADQVQPGARQQATIEGLTDLAQQAGFYINGVRLDRPVRMLALDPGRFGSAVIVVVEVADEDAVRALADRLDLAVQLHRGHAALGRREVLEVAGGYALTPLLAQPVAAVPTATLDMAYVVEHYRGVVEAGLAAMLAQSPPEQRGMMEGILGLYVAVLTQVARVEVSVELDGDRAAIITRLHPVAGGGLARFIAAQHPASFAQVARLTGGSMVMAGDLELGQVWDAMAPMMGTMMAGIYGGPVAGLEDYLRTWASLDLGEFAMVADFALPGMTATGLIEVSDPAKLARFWTAQQKMMAAALKGKMEYRTSTATHRGSKLLITVATPGKDLPEEQRAALAAIVPTTKTVFATAGKRAVYAIGAQATEEAKAMIDALASGKVAPMAAHPLAPVVAEATRRRESAFMTFDMAALMARFGGGASSAAPPKGAPAVMGIGADAGALTFRFTMPASQVKAIMGAQQSGSGSADQIIQDMSDLADEVCACSDMTCAESVMKRMSQLKEPGGKPSKAQMERAMAIAERMATCQKRLMSATP